MTDKPISLQHATPRLADACQQLLSNLTAQLLKRLGIRQKQAAQYEQQCLDRITKYIMDGNPSSADKPNGIL